MIKVTNSTRNRTLYLSEVSVDEYSLVFPESYLKCRSKYLKPVIWIISKHLSRFCLSMFSLHSRPGTKTSPRSSLCLIFLLPGTTSMANQQLKPK